MFFGCGPNWKSVKLPSVYESDDKINIVGQSGDTKLEILNKQPKASNHYEIVLSGSYDLVEEYIRVREVIYSDYKDWYRNGTWDDKATESHYIYTSDFITKEPKSIISSKNGNTILYQAKCETSTKGHTCKPEFKYNSFRTYLPNKQIRDRQFRFFNFNELEPNLTNLSSLRQRIFNFNKIFEKHKIFTINKSRISKDTLKSNDIEMLNVPDWIQATKKNDLGKIFVDLFIKEKGTSFFNNEYKQFGISKDYNYLLSKFTDKKILRLKIETKNKLYRNIELAYYDASRLFAEIKRLEAMGYGFIKFTANQQGVDIYIDGVNKGSITDKPFVAKLVEGDHTITAKKYLFGSNSIKVKMKSDDAFSYHFELKPSGDLSEEVGSGKIVQSVGILTVVTTRNDLKVDLEGAQKIPPFKIPNMATGAYRIKVLGPGFSKDFNIEVQPDKNNVVNLDKLLK